MSEQEVKAIVQKVDADGNGFISPEEFKCLVNQIDVVFKRKLTDEQVEKALNSIDKDGDGKFSIKEVVDWMLASGYFPEVNEDQGNGWLGYFKNIADTFKDVVDDVVDAVVDIPV